MILLFLICLLIFIIYLFLFYDTISLLYYFKPLEANQVPALCGAYNASTSESMQTKIVGCLCPIAVRQGNINTNKVMCYTIRTKKNYIYKKKSCSVLNSIINLIFIVGHWYFYHGRLG
jgi:hypothetical protein